MRDALHHVAVAADREDVVVADLGTEAGAEVRLGDRHADAVPESLSERSGRDLDARRQNVFWVSRRFGMKLTKPLYLIERKVVTGEMQQAVQQHRSMTRR